MEDGEHGLLSVHVQPPAEEERKPEAVFATTQPQLTVEPIVLELLPRLLLVVLLHVLVSDRFAKNR